MAYCRICELGDRFFRIPPSGSRKPNWAPSHDGRAAQDYAGGGYADGFRAIFCSLYEREAIHGLLLGGSLSIGSRILYFSKQDHRRITIWMKVSVPSLLEFPEWLEVFSHNTVILMIILHLLSEPLVSSLYGLRSDPFGTRRWGMLAPSSH